MPSRALRPRTPEGSPHVRAEPSRLDLGPCERGPFWSLMCQEVLGVPWE